MHKVSDFEIPSYTVYRLLVGSLLTPNSPDDCHCMTCVIAKYAIKNVLIQFIDVREGPVNVSEENTLLNFLL